MVASGSIIAISVASKSTLTSGPSSILQQVASDLSGTGIVVRSANLHSLSFLDQLVPAMLFEGQAFSVDYQIGTLMDFNSSDDIASILAHSFYDITGYLPGSISVVSVTPPGGTAQVTGQPGAVAPGAGVITSAGSGIIDTVSSFLSGLKSTTITILIIIVGVIILALVLFAYGPNVKGVASALA